jgi:hypothetical protein
MYIPTEDMITKIVISYISLYKRSEPRGGPILTFVKGNKVMIQAKFLSSGHRSVYDVVLPDILKSLVIIHAKNLYYRHCGFKEENLIDLSNLSLYKLIT